MNEVNFVRGEINDKKFVPQIPISQKKKIPLQMPKTLQIPKIQVLKERFKFQ